MSEKHYQAYLRVKSDKNLALKPIKALDRNFEWLLCYFYREWVRLRGKEKKIFEVCILDFCRAMTFSAWTQLSFIVLSRLFVASKLSLYSSAPLLYCVASWLSQGKSKTLFASKCRMLGINVIP